MGEFSFVNIFTTKGVEYLWIIAYLLMLVAVLPVLYRLGNNAAGAADPAPDGKPGGEPDGELQTKEGGEG